MAKIDHRLNCAACGLPLEGRECEPINLWGTTLLLCPWCADTPSGFRGGQGRSGWDMERDAEAGALMVVIIVAIAILAGLWWLARLVF